MKSIKSIAATLALLSAPVAFGASSYMFDNPENHSYLGVRASLDFSSAGSGGSMYNNSPGFSVGAVYNIPLWQNLYFEPSLALFYDTFGTSQWKSFDRPVLNNAGLPVLDNDGNAMTEEAAFQINGSIHNFGFRIPLNVGYHFDFTEDISVSVFTGPQLNLNVIARYHQDAVHVQDYETPAESCSIFGTKGFKTFDLQWNFGAGVTYQNYYLAFQGGVGITHMKSATEMLPRNLRRNLFSITLGYNF